MVNSIKCSREVKKTETRYFLRAYGIDEVIMDIQKSRLNYDDDNGYNKW